MDEFHVYHISEARTPEVHDTEDGDWFFEPKDWAEGEVYSCGFRTRELAEKAIEKWSHIQELERYLWSDRREEQSFLDYILSKDLA